MVKYGDVLMSLFNECYNYINYVVINTITITITIFLETKKYPITPKSPQHPMSNLLEYKKHYHSHFA